MSRDSIEDNWKEFANSVKQQWSKLSEEQIKLIHGEREKLATLIHDVYGTSKAEVEKQISAWQSLQASVWDRLQLNWKHFSVDLHHQWNKLTREQLDAIGGNRDKLIKLIQETYGNTREEVERQLSAWESRQKEGWATVQENWQQLLGSVHEYWDKLSKEQIEAIAGQRDKLVSTLQEVYGSTREVVEKQIAAWQEQLKQAAAPVTKPKDGESKKS